MANSNIFLGNIKIRNAKLGLSDVKLCLGEMTIYPTSVPLTDAVVTCSDATYNGVVQTAQDIVVVLSGITLVEDVDYIVTKNNGGTNVGTYEVEIQGINNYEDYASGTFTINKVTPTVTAPTAKSLTYNGSAQQLVNAGSTNYGTLQYSSDNSTWGTAIPSGTNATDYTVWYKVVGDSNINDVAAASIPCSITRASRTISFTTAPTTVIKGKTITVVATPSAGSGDGTITYSSSNSNIASVNGNTISGVSNGSCTITATISQGTNYSSASTSYTLSVKTYDTQYLTFVATESGTFKFSGNSINYSLNSGTTWTSLASNTNTPTVSAGRKIMWKATLTPTSSIGIGTFVSSGNFTVEGNAMSLLYGDNYSNQTSLNGKNYAFYKLFSGCTRVTSAENLSLPATTLAQYCYQQMFRGCTSLTTAPSVLSATTLQYSCYHSMFYGCSALTIAPSLPATTLQTYCYAYMFDGCTSLTTAPELPATTLASYCYNYMFENCTSLTTAPSVLPATTLAEGCYQDMFIGCTSLTTAPELPATTLASYCYSHMFYNCRSLNYIKCMLLCVDSNSLGSWVYGVASSGTFIGNEYAGWTTGSSGIPNGWTFNDISSQQCTPYSPSISLSPQGYVKFTSNGKSIFGLVRKSSYHTIYVSKDASLWQSVDNNDAFAINNGEYYYVCGFLESANTQSNYTNFMMSNKISVSGNCNSIWNYSNLNSSLKEYCGYKMFYGCSALTTAPSLPATSLTDSCYSSMFRGCRSLTTAPSLPATTIAYSCYSSMFYGCTSLTTAPSLPATTLRINCYNSMFYDCTNLTTAPSLPATTLQSNCYSGMFQGCTSLTTAPSLPATTLALSCYSGMFQGCTSLTTAPSILPATTLQSYCYLYMFFGCTSLTTAPTLSATTLAEDCYYGMFISCTSLTTAPTLSATTLAEDCYSGMFQGCRSLTTAPSLPATTLATRCYYNMFWGCTSLTTAPILSATTLTTSCYAYMFYNCSKLNSITCLATDISATNCTNNWVSGVASSGTFTKAASMSSWTTGSSGVPSGWSVQNAT